MTDDECKHLAQFRVQAKGCCDAMTAQLNYDCIAHHGNGCPDVVISKTKEGNFVLHAPNADYYANFCPWCGTKLPEAQ